MMEIILGIVLVVLTICLNFLFIKVFVSDIKHEKTTVYYWCALLLIELVSSIVFREVMGIKLLINYSSLVLFYTIAFSLSIKKSLVINAFFFGLFAVIEGLISGIYQTIFGVDVFTELLNETGAFFIEIISMLVLMVVILIIGVIIRKSFIFSQITIKGWGIFVLFPLFSFVSVSMLVINYDKNIFERMRIPYFVICGSLLILNFLLFYLLSNVVHREREFQENRALINQAELTNRMYKSLAEDREKQKAKSHDYINHLNVMLALLKSGDVEEGIKYLSEQLNEERLIIDMFDTGNIIINSVLNIKYAEATDKGIVFSIIIDTLSDIKISDSDLVTILSNLLDNAIEASEKCDKKRIILKIRKSDNQLFIFESNTCSGCSDNSFKTTKNDKENHGYGIANIERTVHKNNGNYTVHFDDGVYKMTIVFPL